MKKMPVQQQAKQKARQGQSNSQRPRRRIAGDGRLRGFMVAVFMDADGQRAGPSKVALRRKPAGI